MTAATRIPDKYKDHTFSVTAYGETTKVRMTAENYGNNGRLRINLLTVPEKPDDFEEPYGTLTTNITDDDPGEEAFFVKTWSEGAALSHAVFQTGIFEDVEHPAETAWRFKP